MTLESNNIDVEVESKPDRTLVLLGKTGNGKSATGNTILGGKKFLSKRSANAITKQCEMHSVMLPNGQQINVIDTPGLFSASMSQDFTIQEIVRCLLLAKNGIDAVLLVFSADGRFTEEEQSTLPKLETLFGNEIVNHMIVVFTNGDKLEKSRRTLEDHLAKCPPLQEIVQKCSGRKVLFDNRPNISESKKIKQRQELLDLVEEIAKKNNGKPYMRDLSLELKEKNVINEENQKLVESMKGRSSNQEIAEVREEVEKSYKEMLKGVEEKIANQLKESLKAMTDQLANVEAEKAEILKHLSDIEKLSSDEITKLTEKLDKAVKEATSLGEEIKKGEKGGVSCINCSPL